MSYHYYPYFSVSSPASFGFIWLPIVSYALMYIFNDYLTLDAFRPPSSFCLVTSLEETGSLRSISPVSRVSSQPSQVLRALPLPSPRILPGCSGFDPVISDTLLLVGQEDCSPTRHEAIDCSAQLLFQPSVSWCPCWCRSPS